MTQTATAPKAPTTKIKLEFPIEYQGAGISEVTIRRPKGKDMRFLPKGDNAGTEEMYPFFALLMGLDEGAIDEMDAVDIAEISGTVMGFLQRKGGKSRR
jgi:hypothetical protein